MSGDTEPPVTRCVGAFRRPCLMATTAVLCDPCWDAVARVSPEARAGVAAALRASRAPTPRDPWDIEWTPGAIEVPIRGDVE